MRRTPVTLVACAAVLTLVAACSTRPVSNGTLVVGTEPQLPAPERPGLFPTVNIAPARGWPEGARPEPAAGLAVVPLACGLAHPRWLHVLPNGDVLVAETDAPARKDADEGLRGWIMKRVMKRAGSGAPSADRISLLRDADRDGIAELQSVFIADLHSPFGMALVDDALYVANTDALLRFAYREGATSIDTVPVRVAALPGGERNRHWTKSLVASRDGRRLYVGVGSNSNIAEHGIEQERDRAAILEIDPADGSTRVFASGLRNPVGMAWEPHSGALWVAVNERDELGDDLVPDYITSVRDGAFYGWPWSYWGGHVDTRVAPQRADLVARASVPDYALGAHTASLGLAFAAGDALPARYREGAFVGQHGSWNRRVPSGYKVVFVPFVGGKPAGAPEDVLGGFLDRDGDAYGRPVGVEIARDGALLVADDVGGCVWRVSAREAVTRAVEAPSRPR
jgi:glucose/arabinose dehydrogenase